MNNAHSRVMPVLPISDALFTSNTPMLDVRAPVEFAQGAFPHTVNLPLMTDDERHHVGLCYKQSGQEAAIRLGHELVSGQTKAQRLERWIAFTAEHPQGVIYCFRGGLRSQTVQQWLMEAGVTYPRVAGGYKAMRQHLLSALSEQVAKMQWIVVGGMTGTGKTDVIQALPNHIDLEGLAHHRGSSFGKHATAQPSQIDFENSLSIALLKQSYAGYTQLAIEDESRTIGRCALPLDLRERMLSSPIVWVQAALQERVNRIVRDYVERLSSEYARLYTDSDKAFTLFSEHLLTALDNLQKKLGHVRHLSLRLNLQESLAMQQKGLGFAQHASWIKPLFEHYYDPMYAYQHDQKKDRIIFEGDIDAVTAFLNAQRSQ